MLAKIIISFYLAVLLFLSADLLLGKVQLFTDCMLEASFRVLTGCHLPTYLDLLLFFLFSILTLLMLSKHFCEFGHLLKAFLLILLEMRVFIHSLSKLLLKLSQFALQSIDLSLKSKILLLRFQVFMNIYLLVGFFLRSFNG